MRRPALLAIVLIAATAAKTQDNHTQAKAASCDKLPYRLGHLVTLNSTDLRSDSHRKITKKEWKELEKKGSALQAKCDAFVRSSPGRPVSTEFSYEVSGFAAYYVRCESFCGTEQDLLQQDMKEVEDVTPTHK